MSEESSRTIEDTLAERLNRFGVIAAIAGLIALAIIAFGNVLIRFLHVVVNFVLLLIVNQGPIVAAILGGVSTFATYYGWFRVVRRREKLNAREEAKGQAIDQAGNLLQRVPANPGCLSGCSSRLSLVVLVGGLLLCLLTYGPQPLGVLGANQPSSSSPNLAVTHATPTPIAPPGSTPAPLPTATPHPGATATPRPAPAATNTPQPAPTATNTPRPVPTATPTNTPVPPPGKLDVLTPTVDLTADLNQFCGGLFTGAKFSFTNTGGMTIYWTVSVPTAYTIEPNYPVTGTLQPFQGDSQTDFFDGVATNLAKISIFWGNSPNAETNTGTVTTICKTIG
jgi:hypothetical protein